MKSLDLKKCVKRFLLIFLVSAGTAGAESIQVDYYGVVSSSSDANMLKMAQDVFFTQLKSIDYLVVYDKRPDILKVLASPPSIDLNSAKIAFYAEIDEEKDLFGKTKWNCKFEAANPKDGTAHSKSDTFESYYKILVNAKKSIESVFDDFRIQKKITQDADSQSIVENALSGVDIESLSGTWIGEPETDKIIVLRGGRGFVVYKNGATMNIRILADRDKANSIEVRQVGKSNASFFTELPRQTALEAATSAEPIVWKFVITSQNSLEGVKTTLVPDEDGIKKGDVPSSWTRK